MTTEESFVTTYVDNVGWVHKRFEANLSSRCVWPARLVNRPFSTANDVGGRINSVAEAVDHLAVQFGLPGCQNIQADYFCKIAKKFDVINEIEKES